MGGCNKLGGGVGENGKNSPLWRKKAVFGQNVEKFFALCATIMTLGVILIIFHGWLNLGKTESYPPPIHKET